MPENPTINEIMDKLKLYIENAERTHNLFVANLWVTEAKVLLSTLESVSWALE